MTVGHHNSHVLGVPLDDRTIDIEKLLLGLDLDELARH